LASWDRSEQVTWRRTRKSFEDSYLQILESANHARPDRIGWVWLHPKRRQVSPQDASSFREEFYEFLARENGLSDPDWEQPHGASVQKFCGFPTVAESSFDFAAFGLRVGRALSNDSGVFDRIFLFNPYEARKVLHVYPMRAVNP
jgi:hypothetical protein